MNFATKTIIAAATAIIASAPLQALAQTWPDKTVRLIVPYPAGGGVDPVARLLGKKLAERWSVPVVVENKPGASGMIGASHVARSDPDGTTIMVSATAEVVINQHIMKSMTYDPEKDLQPVTLAVRLPFLLVANPSQPFKTVAELVSYAKKNPGKVTYASSGNGTPQHLAALLLENMADIKMTHVPYKGVAPSITDLLAGHVNVGFAGLPTALPHVQKNALQALAVSSKEPSSATPNVPPVAATQGLGNYELNQWFGIFVRAGTPDKIVQKIQTDVADVLRMPDVKETLVQLGAQPSGMPTEEFTQFVKAESKKFGGIVKAAGLTEQ